MIIIAVAAVAVAAMLFVRLNGHRDGSYFEDGDRASGVFGFLATGFSVLLGFIVFLALPRQATTSREAAPSRRR